MKKVYKKLLGLITVITVGFVAFFVLGILVIQDKYEPRKEYYYVENELSFYKPYDIKYGLFKWIRKAENIKVAHESFKKFGYKKLLEIDPESEWCFIAGDINKPCLQLLDSLLITYKEDKIESKYYKEFWARRKIEKNDSIVYEVLKEISDIIVHNENVEYDKNIVNDTLVNLITISDYQDSISDERAIMNFNYLKRIGMHESAYNLLYERDDYYSVEWNRENLVQGLIQDNNNCCPYPFIMDNTK